MKSVVLLKGINVGGNHKLPMAQLRKWLDVAQFTSVETYIQSGNVVLEHSSHVDVKKEVRDLLTEHTGWDIATMVRSTKEMNAVVSGNPYSTTEPSRLHVSFLDEVSDAAELTDAGAWQPEEFTALGREVYLHLPSGMGRSVMVPRLKLVKNATTRNWNTVMALAQLVNR